MMQNSKYTVLMSVYYKEKPEYLSLSIESMLNQTNVHYVDCHAHADQRATSEILVSLHQLLAACVEAPCHAGKCAE